MFDFDELLKLGAFSQLIPIWHVLFFIASLLPFLLLNRVKICLLITYLFSYYLGFMVIFGEHIASSGSMQLFVLYALSGLGIAIFFVATIFNEAPEQTEKSWLRYSRPAGDQETPIAGQHKPVEPAATVARRSGKENR